MESKKSNWDDLWYLRGPFFAAIIICAVVGYNSWKIVGMLIGAAIGVVIGIKLALLIAILRDMFFDIFPSMKKDENLEEEDEASYQESNYYKKNEAVINPEYYSILESTPKDNLETIKRNYRRLLMEFHPDKLGNGASNSIKQHAKEMTQKLVEAYEMIELSRNIYKK
jgi:hypothetical protein